VNHAPSTPFEAFSTAVLANDQARAASLLADHADLRGRLDEPLQNGPFGATALLVAVRHRNRELIDLLLLAGAGIDIRSHWWAGGFGVLDNDSGLESFLIERGATVDAYAAARHGMLDRLATLVDRDPGVVRSRGGDGQTPLHVAKTVDVAQLLLDHGADIDALDVDHESTAAQYLLRDRPDVARYLISRGCRTDLLMAAAVGDLDLARRHLDADPARIRMTVSDRYFPKQNPHAGGSIYIWVLGRHKTAALVARDFHHEDLHRWLMDRSPDDWKLAQACELGDESLVDEILAARPSLTAALPADTRQRLANVAEHDNVKAVDLMLDAGWPVDARSDQGATPLHWAAFHGNVAMTTALLRRHPPLESRDDAFNATPLGWAMHGSVHGWHRGRGDYAGTVSALRQAGAETPPETAATVASDEVRRGLGWKNLNGT
jgi:ankyrin repeat protein